MRRDVSDHLEQGEQGDIIISDCDLGHAAAVVVGRLRYAAQLLLHLNLDVPVELLARAGRPAARELPAAT